jgi:exodeoxyribonuclease-3
MKIATWNVNYFKVRLPNVLDWLAATQTDVLCVQETKMEDKVFPYAELQAAGYHAVHNGQKTYNGVAILSRFEMAGVCFDIPAFDDPQKRVLAATIKGVRIVCGYMPNGQAVGSEKYDYKLKWFAALTRWLQQEMAQHTQMALLGDFNIAPEDRDVHDPVAWKDQILCSEPERAAFRQLQALGLQDAFRLFDQPEKIFSWWDYRQMGFRLNRGLRIDHILLNPELAGRCRSCVVDKAPRKLERPSDHAPVVAELDELSAADQPGPSGNG